MCFQFCRVTSQNEIETIGIKVNARVMVQPYVLSVLQVTSQNEIETTGIKLERPVVQCSQCLETTECEC